MILTVTLNAALDVTYEIERLVPNSAHRVTQQHAQAGGKGVNVSRVLAALEQDTCATGLVGGATGQAIREEVVSGFPEAFLSIGAESRRTHTMVSGADGDATLFNETGPRVSTAEWSAFRDHFTRMIATVDVAVCSGSLPPGVPDSAYAELVELARSRGVPTVIDATGAALTAAAAAGPTVVKPNAQELVETTGHRDPLLGARALRDMGAQCVAVSLGAEGLLVVNEDTAVRVTPPERVRGNPTGAGDATVAAIATGLAAGHTWGQIAKDAVALSAAAVHFPVAGGFSTPDYIRYQSAVRVEDVSVDSPWPTTASLEHEDAADVHS
ncbi:1-phosphofructokinase family hexose kinase [Spiractinospora alimapuensis]|uniref:1-phosphofructokinase family hexose kinase n=1 Tax=Spiractinospora alimapuensis TaxID=2820884 RepID=UPI001F277B42|nr:1-phosphofructokinase family hexose kinase [Spiractinospora alimapuensis]